MLLRSMLLIVRSAFVKNGSKIACPCSPLLLAEAARFIVVVSFVNCSVLQHCVATAYMQLHVRQKLQGTLECKYAGCPGKIHWIEFPAGLAPVQRCLIHHIPWIFWILIPNAVCTGSCSAPVPVRLC